MAFLVRRLDWDQYARSGVGGSSYSDDLAVMDDSSIYEAFGSDLAKDVYNHDEPVLLLTSFGWLVVLAEPRWT